MSTRKKIYDFSFAGHWPVGACGIVQASSKVEAIELIEKALQQVGLPQTIEEHQVDEWNPAAEPVKILLDGDY